MIQLLALFGLIALSIDQSVAQCMPIVDGYNQYDVALCTLNSTNNVPPTIDTPNYWVPTSVDTSLSTVFKFNFSVNIYGVPHDSFFMVQAITHYHAFTSIASRCKFLTSVLWLVVPLIDSLFNVIDSSEYKWFEHAFHYRTSASIACSTSCSL